MVGVACLLCVFGGGDILVCLVTFIASMMGYSLRLWLSNRNFNPLYPRSWRRVLAPSLPVPRCCGIGNDPHIAMASSVLWLVPSFPLINSLSDMLQRLYEHRYRALYVCDYLDVIELYRHRVVIATTKYQSLGRGLMKAFDKILLPILGRVKMAIDAIALIRAATLLAWWRLAGHCLSMYRAAIFGNAYCWRCWVTDLENS